MVKYPGRLLVMECLLKVCKVKINEYRKLNYSQEISYLQENHFGWQQDARTSIRSYSSPKESCIHQ